MWVQGCTLGCPGCFNPETHPAAPGRLVKVEALCGEIISLGSTIEGLTISGGEPFQQPEALASVLRKIRGETSLSILVFTGFTWPEIDRMGVVGILNDVDVLIAGRYQQHRRIARDLAGSSNKTFHFLTGRYTPIDFEAVPPAEILIDARGQVTLTGIDPILWKPE